MELSNLKISNGQIKKKKHKISFITCDESKKENLILPLYKEAIMSKGSHRLIHIYGTNFGYFLMYG